jgi:drug/metabolite transporter (DMT)-like permease
MKTLSPTTRTYLLLGLVMLLWAGNSIVGRAVRDDIPPFTLALARWMIAALVVWPFALPHLATDRAALAKGWPWLLVLGLLGVAAFNAFLYKGLHYTTATNALLIQAAVPAVVALLDRALFHARVAPLQALGVAASTAGVVWIVARGQWATLAALHFGPGDLLVGAAVIAWSFYTVLLRCRPPVAPATFVFVTFLIGAAAMAPLAMQEWANGARVHWSLGAFAAFAYVGLLPSVVAYFIYNAATAAIGAARAGQAITLMPLFGALLSALLLGERLHGYHMAGMGMILIGIVLAALALRTKDIGGARPPVALEDRG